MGRVAVLLVILFCYEMLLVDRVRCIRYLSNGNGEDVDVDHKLKLLSTNIQNQSGGSYDRVDIHKQFAFEHLLSKNPMVDFLVPATPLYNKDSGNDFSMNVTSSDKILIAKIPNGSIPVRKKQDFETKQQDTANPSNAFLAVARTKAGGKFEGGGGYLKIIRPNVVGQQYSASRIRLQGGADSIAAGWRVDPTLYVDSQPRFFIRTDVGQSHCFGTRCPGFILADQQFNPEYVMGKISQPGGPIWALPCRIIRNTANGNWNLVLGTDRRVVGYWPSSIFTGLKAFADFVEWGGEAYSPPGTPLPPMGSGNFPTGNVSLDGCVSDIEVFNHKGETTDKFGIETFATDPKLYSVRDGGEYTGGMERVILYGGPGH